VWGSPVENDGQTAGLDPNLSVGSRDRVLAEYRSTAALVEWRVSATQLEQDVLQLVKH